MQIDKTFEQSYLEMDEEAEAHIMRLVYHMFGVVNEIRIISNARIRKGCKSEELCIERQNESEKFLVEKVAAGLDQSRNGVLSISSRHQVKSWRKNLKNWSSLSVSM